MVSGRRRSDLERWLGTIPNLGLAPEHSAVWRLPGSQTWQGGEADSEWKESVRPILRHFVDRVPGSLIEEKEFALVWHYRLVEAEIGEWLAAELVAMLDGMLAETELRAYRGKKIVEVKPIWANKGSVVSELLPQYGNDAFVLGIGDDRTDEDMFAQLPSSAWSVHVGGEPTQARYSVPDPQRVIALLEQLTTVGALK